MLQLKQLATPLIAAVLALAGSIAAAQDAAPAKKEQPKDIVMKGDARCTTCHDENDSPEQLAIGKTRHGVGADKRTPNCESCHGKSEEHEKKAGRGKEKAPRVEVGYTKKSDSSIEKRNNACLACHKGGKHMQWASSQHASADVACADCHQIHAQKDKVRAKATQAEVCYACHKEQRAQSFKLSSHPLRDGKMACSDCHNLHGSSGPKLLTKNTVNETCYSCHAEKRGPFLWEHPPATDDCSICHNPHGSNQQALLKSRAPYLCQQCHQTASGHPNSIRAGTGINGNTGTPASQTVAKGCANCHSQVHGSNHPSGPRFVR